MFVSAYTLKLLTSITIKRKNPRTQNEALNAKLATLYILAREEAETIRGGVSTTAQKILSGGWKKSELRPVAQFSMPEFLVNCFRIA